MLDRRLFVSDVDKLLEAHRSRLRELCGKPIEAIWVAWDEEQDTWFPDEAVIVRVGSDNLEIVCWKLDEIALTWNMIDVSAKPAWVAQWDEARAWFTTDGNQSTWATDMQCGCFTGLSSTWESNDC